MIGEIYRDFFEAYFGPLPEADGSGEVTISNPFRNDPNPSMHINVVDGRFNDFGSGLRGDAPGLYMEMHGAPYPAAVTQVQRCVAGEPWVHPIDPGYVESWCADLQTDIPARAYLTKDRGIPMNVIKMLHVGIRGDRYTIPVYNEYGVVVNIRLYKPNAGKEPKMIQYSESHHGETFTGWGTNRLYPIHMLEGTDTIFICEGEWDAMVLIARGFPAVTATSGASSWNKEWNPKFKDKKVYICYDVDLAGRKGARKVGAQLVGVAKEVHIITLPLSGTKEENDITDYFVKTNHTVEEFKALIDEAPLYALDPQDMEAAPEECLQLALADALDSRYKGRRVGFDVHVVGKDVAPFNIPFKVNFKCQPDDTSTKCRKCEMCTQGGHMTFELKVDPSLLEYIKTNTTTQLGRIRGAAGIDPTCKLCITTEDQSVNLEELILAPAIKLDEDWEGSLARYLLQSAFCVGSSLETNRSYHLEGVMTPDPWSQHVTFLLDKAEPLQDAVDTFSMTPEMYQQLSMFQTNNIEEKFNEIHEDMAANVTHIIGRGDLLTMIDLVYHSVLSFNFQNQFVRRGYLEAICIGDTRTGKSETTEKMMNFLKMGDISVAENTTYSGLVGGLQQTGDKRWIITWGKIPLNDGRLFIIDEASGMTLEDISRMSGLRSSGIAEITKIQTERTNARTRLIWLSNPRSGKGLSSYTFGVQALQELIGHSEDVARFDFALSASNSEIPIELINSVYDPDKKIPHRYTSEACRNLILWAWSKKPDEVIFTDEAIDLILQSAIKLGNEYSSSIPLVEGANQRIKLARMAAATACRVFSTDAEGKNVIIKPEHVQFAVDYLNKIYSKESFDYKGFSTVQKKNEKEAERNAAMLEDMCAMFSGLDNVFYNNMVGGYVPAAATLTLGIDQDAARQCVNMLLNAKLITFAGNSGYNVSNAMAAWLRKHIRDQA